jgi:hypothetical protein
MQVCADNVRGLKPATEAMDFPFGGSGRGALPAGRSRSVSPGGLQASENANMSSAKTGENPVHRKSKVSSGRLVLWRSVGPKARPNGVVDGHRVDIPEPGLLAMEGHGPSFERDCWLFACVPDAGP